MKILSRAGAFAGDKDAAAAIRDDYLVPRLGAGQTCILDFQSVELATQSFIYALLASVIRNEPSDLSRIDFRNCNDSIQALIEIVSEYAQDEFE